MWEDGQEVRYSRWSENQPRHVDGAPNCVSMNVSTGEWSSVACNSTVIKPYVCKISNGESLVPSLYILAGEKTFTFRLILINFSRCVLQFSNAMHATEIGFFFAV